MKGEKRREKRREKGGERRKERWGGEKRKKKGGERRGGEERGVERRRGDSREGWERRREESREVNSVACVCGEVCARTPPLLPGSKTVKTRPLGLIFNLHYSNLLTITQFTII